MIVYSKSIKNPLIIKENIFLNFGMIILLTLKPTSAGVDVIPSPFSGLTEKPVATHVVMVSGTWKLN